MKRWSELGVGPRLGLVALALGAVAVFSQPHRGPFVTLDARELAAIVEQEVDHVTAPELASWIIEGRADYRLIDLRSPEEYARYHIPTAENVTLSALPEYPLLPNEKVVLYSGGGIHSAQAWFLLRARGYKGVYMVLDGLNAWTDEVLYPAAPAEADAGMQAAFERAASVARFFGGEPRTATGEAAGAAMPELPALAPPAAAPVVPVAPRAKRREGC